MPGFFLLGISSPTACRKYFCIVGAILALFGIAVAAKKKHDDKQIAKTDKKIDDNKQQAVVISGKIEAIEDQKTHVKQDLAELIVDVKNLKDKKQTYQKNNLKYLLNKF